MNDRTLIACKWCGRGIIPHQTMCGMCAALPLTRLIIAGTRTFRDYETLQHVIWLTCRFHKWKLGVVLSGGASGADALGERWAKENGIVVVRYPALWYEYGKAAGPLRNQTMVENADALLAFWDGKSKGTADIVQRAEKAKLDVHVHEIIGEL